MKEKLVLLISITCLFFEQSFGQKRDPFSMEFKNCNEAFQRAIEDVKNDTLYYYGNNHYRSKGEILQLDSIYKSEYNIHVIRTGKFSSDFTERCYDKFISNHMDSIYDHHFEMRIWNIYLKLNGREKDTIPKSIVYKNRVEEPEE